jgi:hypothetical protein
MKISKRRIFWHSILWSSLFFYHWLVYSEFNDKDYEGAFYWAVVNTSVLAVATYFAIFILIEKFFLTGKRLEFYVVLLSSLTAFAVLRRVINYYFIFSTYFPEKCKQPAFDVVRILAEGFGIAMIAGMGVMFYFINKWSEERQANQKLMNDKLEAQMELLKSQVQPHFIFNTLNNIYSLSISNPSLTSEMIYRLSGLLSYMLYDSKLNIIPIEKEIEYINHFIKLQKLRYGNRLDISLNEYDDLSNINIPPLLILPFVENAFKHGVGNQLDKCWISIDFSANEKEVTIKVENNLIENKNATIPNENSGIGIENVRNRLNILYPNQYSLKIIPSESTYLVVLRLPLNAKGKNKVEEASLYSIA